MEAEEPRLPIKPVRKIAPEEIELGGNTWRLSGSPGELAVYKLPGFPFHLSVSVASGRTHASPEGPPLEGTSLHVYVDRIDNYVATHLAAAAEAWLADLDQMRGLCAEVSNSWAQIKRTLRLRFKADRSDYYHDKSVYDAWQAEHSQTPGDGLEKRLAKEKNEHARRRIADARLAEARTARLAKVEKTSDGRWRVGPVNRKNVFYHTPPDLFQLAESNLMWTPEAYQLAEDGEFLLAERNKRLYICSLKDLLACERVTARMLWVADLETAEYDSTGFLRAQVGSFRASASVMDKICAESVYVPPRTAGCFKVHYKGKTVVVWPDNPRFRIPTEQEWLDWYNRLPEAKRRGADISVQSGQEIVTYRTRGKLPPEPSVGTPGCWRISDGKRMLAIKVEGNQEYFERVDDALDRKKWIRSLPPGSIIFNGSHNIPYLTADNVVYRLARGEVGNLLAESVKVPPGTPNCFRVPYASRNIIFCPALHGSYAVRSDQWSDVISRLPEATVEGGILTIDLPAAPKFKLKGRSLPSTDVGEETVGACYLKVDGGDLIISPMLQKSHFEEISTSVPADRKKWIAGLPVAKMDRQANISYKGVLYRGPRRLPEEISVESYSIRTGTDRCFMLDVPGIGILGPMLENCPWDPLVKFDDWDIWMREMWTARQISASLYVVPGSNPPEFFEIDSRQYIEPLVGTADCFIVISPDGDRTPIDPSDESYCRRVWFEDYDEFEFLLNLGGHFLVREAGVSENTWETLFWAGVSHSPGAGKPILLMDGSSGGKKWSGSFVSEILPLDKSAWVEALERRVDTNLIMVDSEDEAAAQEGVVSVGSDGTQGPVALSTTDPTLCFSPPGSGVWFLARHKETWRPVRFTDMPRKTDQI